MKVPEGWFVYEAGQNLVTMDWFVNLLHVEDTLTSSNSDGDGGLIRRVFVADHVSFEEAMSEAATLIAEGKWTSA